jgi:hypothetical protein
MVRFRRMPLLMFLFKKLDLGENLNLTFAVDDSPTQGFKRLLLLAA